MNECISYSELKYKNKQHLNSIYRSYILLCNCLDEIKSIVQELEVIINRGRLIQLVQNLENNTIVENDTLNAGL